MREKIDNLSLICNNIEYYFKIFLLFNSTYTSNDKYTRIINIWLILFLILFGAMKKENEVLLKKKKEDNLNKLLHN